MMAWNKFVALSGVLLCAGFNPADECNVVPETSSTGASLLQAEVARSKSESFPNLLALMTSADSSELVGKPTSAPAKKAPVEKTLVEQAPDKKAPVEQATDKKAPVEQAMAQENSAVITAEESKAMQEQNLVEKAGMPKAAAEAVATHKIAAEKAVLAQQAFAETVAAEKLAAEKAIEEMEKMMQSLEAQQVLTDKKNAMCKAAAEQEAAERLAAETAEALEAAKNKASTAQKRVTKKQAVVEEATTEQSKANEVALQKAEEAKRAQEKASDALNNATRTAKAAQKAAAEQAKAHDTVANMRAADKAASKETDAHASESDVVTLAPASLLQSAGKKDHVRPRRAASKAKILKGRIHRKTLRRFVPKAHSKAKVKTMHKAPTLVEDDDAQMPHGKTKVKAVQKASTIVKHDQTQGRSTVADKSTAAHRMVEKKLAVAHDEASWRIENAKYMSSGVCRKWLRDQESKFFWMWSAYGWSRRHPGDPACWGHRGESADRFFNDARSGEQCQQNWNYQWGHGLDHAPAVFGFPETMQDYCNAHNTRPGNHRWDLAGSCQEANINILRIDNWDMCKNLQWSFCAMQGLLPGQGRNQKIYFSKTPKTLDISDFLEGRHHRCCGEFAENDIYYLEVCTLDEICRNSNELWTLEVGDPFVCDIDDVKYHQLKDALTRWD